MKRRIIWLVVSVLIVLSLVLASCAPKVTEEEVVVTEEKKVAVTEEKKVVTEEKKVVKEEALLPYQKAAVPKYGGTMNLFQETDPRAFDQAGFPSCMPYPIHQTNEKLISYDLAKGPGGTGEWLEGFPFPTMQSLLAPGLVESWEWDFPNGFTLHIRKGVRFQDKPPANGREMTAEDLLFSLRRAYGTLNSYPRTTMKGLRDMENVANSIYLDPDDPWAVVVEVDPELPGNGWEGIVVQIYVIPKEVGDGNLKKWQDAIGTGPFYLTDYVSGSSLTFQKNPNYWKKDQLYPQNQLPYVDVVKIIIMPDWATRLAALQTGKIDQLIGIPLETAEILWRYNPNLRYVKYLRASSGGLSMRHDVKPFDDLRVRRAMMMAIDQPEILRDYYRGDGELFWGPVFPVAEHAYLWVPLEEFPESVQKLYGYYPDEAAKLLDEAGYPGPQRFTTSVTVWSEEQIDLASLVVAYWAKVGVTLNIDVREAAVYQSMLRARTFPSGSMELPTASEPFKFCSTGKTASRNVIMINYDYIEQHMSDMSVNYFNRAEQARLTKIMAIKYQEDVIHQRLALPYVYRFWQPWLKGYYGENVGAYIHSQEFAQYAWIDQDLKQQITGRR